MEFLSHYKRVFIILMVFLCITTMIISARTGFRPVFLETALGAVLTPAQSGITGGVQWVSERFGERPSDIDQLIHENAILVLEVERLTTENNRLALIESESAQLRALLQVSERYRYLPTTGARAIAFDTSNWFDTFRIDKGQRDGIAENMVVLAPGAPGGLAGRVLRAGSTYSVVIPIIDQASSVSAKTVRTEALGVVTGDMLLMNDGLCRMIHINIDAEIMEGDEIITSGLGEIFPAGITIGTVREVRIDSRGLTKYAIIQPAVDFRRIETVLVVTEE